MLETPVAFLIFNRPDYTARVFAEIARARPKKLLVIADGPRNADEADVCAERAPRSRSIGTASWSRTTRKPTLAAVAA